MGSRLKMLLKGKLVFLLSAYLVSGKVDHSNENPCAAPWVQGTYVGLGCLLFNTTKEYTWEDAMAYCQDENSTLLEIQFQEQLEFMLMELDALTDMEGAAHDWWIGATDLGKEGRWMWLQSLSSVPDFLWESDFPTQSNKYNCMYLNDAYHYAAVDTSCQATNYPICQKQL